jgi:hypothetical protein
VRVAAGRVVVTTSCGVELHVDQRLSTTQADLLFRIMERAGTDKDHTQWIEMDEGAIRIKTVDNDVPLRVP